MYVGLVAMVHQMVVAVTAVAILGAVPPVLTVVLQAMIGKGAVLDLRVPVFPRPHALSPAVQTTNYGKIIKKTKF